jgi:hypothetical protein
MNRAVRNGVIAVRILILVLLILPLLVDVNSFRPKIESELSSALNRQVKVGNLSLRSSRAALGRTTSPSPTMQRSARICL